MIGVTRASFDQSARAVKGPPPARLDTDRSVSSLSGRPHSLSGARPLDKIDEQGEQVKRIYLIVSSALALLACGHMAAATGDATAGEADFRMCKTCHQIGEGAKNFVGPELNGIVGRKAGTAAGYHYSDANKNSGITWDEATLAKYLKRPREVMPGTKMAFPGLPSDEDIANVIAYLKQFGPDGRKQ
jgi:cytochrome c